MHAIRRLFLRSWRSLVLGFSIAVIAWLLYFRRLNDLVPGYSTAELTTYHAAGNWHDILRNPVNVPYKLLVWFHTAVLHHSIFADRAISATTGLAAALLFFVVVRAWCTYRVAFLSTIMFATSAGLLHFARLGTADILQMSVLAMLAVVLWYRKQREHRAVLAYLLVLLLALLWYVPGMIWFELLGFFTLRATVQGQLRRTKAPVIASLLVLFAACITPLAIAAAKSPRLLLQVIGLPEQLHTLSHVGGNLWNLLLGISVRNTNGNPLWWVGHAPLLDAIEVIAALLGAFYIVRGRSGRRAFMAGSVIIGFILASLGGAVTFACLVPMLYLFAATGLDHLLERWLAVFPRNPVARLSGISVMCAMVGFSVLYQVRTYYVAWPHAPATQAAFKHPAP